MKRNVMMFAVIAAFTVITVNFSLAAENNGITVKLDGCTILVILQVGVDGTNADVDTVKKSLEKTYTKECPLGWCTIKSSVVVKKWSDIPAADTGKYSKVTMVDDDKNPSFTHEGTPNGANGNGTWRRGRRAEEYGHEAGHLSGL